MIYLDTRVIVNSFFVKESGSKVSQRLMEKIREGVIIAITSEFTLIEIASAISRGTREPTLSKEFVRELRQYPNLTVIPISKMLIDKSLDISSDYGLRAGDSIHVACAILENAKCLVQRDVDFGKASRVIKILEPERII